MVARFCAPDWSPGNALYGHSEITVFGFPARTAGLQSPAGPAALAERACGRPAKPGSISKPDTLQQQFGA
jgi:hypothetical protein